MPQRTTYLKVSLPAGILEAVDKILAESSLEYRSRAEFIAEAVREKILALVKDRVVPPELLHSRIASWQQFSGPARKKTGENGKESASSLERSR